MLQKVSVVRGWVWPGLMLFVLAILLSNFAADAFGFAGTLGVYRVLVYVVGFTLCWHFRRSRAAAVLLGLFMMDMLLRPSSAALVLGAGSVWDASGVLFLFLMAVVAAMRDRGLRSTKGFTQVSIVLVGLVGGLLLWAVRPEFLSWTWQPFLPWDLGILGLSDGILVTGLFAALVTGGLALGRRHRLDKAFFWIALSVLMALRGGSESVESTIYLAMAGLILIINVLEKSYSLSVRDDITGLPTRRALRREIKRAGSRYALAFVGVDGYYDLYDRHGRDASDRVIKKVAVHLGESDRTGRAFRFSNHDFAVVYPGKGRNDVLADLESLRTRIEDFRFSLRPNAKRAGEAEPPHYPAVRWPLTVSVGVAERGGRKGWSARYGAIARSARGALHRGRKAGGNIVSK